MSLWPLSLLHSELNQTFKHFLDDNTLQHYKFTIPLLLFFYFLKYKHFAIIIFCKYIFAKRIFLKNNKIEKGEKLRGSVAGCVLYSGEGYFHLKNV